MISMLKSKSDPKGANETWNRPQNPHQCDGPAGVHSPTLPARLRIPKEVPKEIFSVLLKK